MMSGVNVIKSRGQICKPVHLDSANSDYELPKFEVLRKMPTAHRATKEQVTKYEKAIQVMRDLDTSDLQDLRGFTQQANFHCAYCNGAHDQVGFNDLDLQVHNSWLFFPFHMWYLYFYERILGKLINDPTFALPFWNWDNPKGMILPPIFDNPAHLYTMQSEIQTITTLPLLI
ncbi:Polyphenol oxidase I [Forsythia ovata]|uniref:Polyphenol oxidase I n=1 Tax=Forsythia ovata TaxID=205694 RepID=A0ABD1U570_9LAMI